MVLRKPRGLRHSLPGILAIAACAVIAGARSFVARGIHPDLVPRLFTPFDRLGAETTGIEGTGVGLALVASPDVQDGGSLIAHSEIGFGSTFIASIPIAARDTDRTRRARQFNQPSEPTSAIRQRRQHFSSTTDQYSAVCRG